MGEILAGQDGDVDSDGPMEINNMMTVQDTYMDDIMRHHYIGDMLESISEPLDVTGYNYMHGRYDVDTAKYPGRVIAGSETCPNSIVYNWSKVEEHPNVIGDFVWIVWGLRKAPYIAVQKPRHYGYPPFMSNWGWPDNQHNWT